jgi:hypothetical protein
MVKLPDSLADDGSRPSRDNNVRLLPEPEGPDTPTISPLDTWMFISLTMASLPINPMLRSCVSRVIDAIEVTFLASAK